MQTVTSKDGTKIAFDKLGSGPAVILVNGAIAYRALPQILDSSLASLYTGTRGANLIFLWVGNIRT